MNKKPIKASQAPLPANPEAVKENVRKNVVRKRIAVHKARKELKEGARETAFPELDKGLRTKGADQTP